MNQKVSKNVIEKSSIKVIAIFLFLALTISTQSSFVLAQPDTTNEAYEWVIEPKFDYIGTFYSNEFASAGVGNTPETLQFGFIDLKGNWILNPTFGLISDFNEDGHVLARVGEWGVGKFGLMDLKGNWIIEPDYELLGFFAANGLAEARIGDVRTGKYGFINKNSEWAIKPIYDFAYAFSDEGIASVSFEGKWGFIDSKGVWVLKPKFDYIGPIGKNGLAIALEGDYLTGKFGYINKYGEWKIKPQFEKAEMFASNGLALVKIGEKWGYINELGKVVIEPKYDEAGTFNSDGMAEVKIGDWYTGKAGYINEKGDWVIKPDYFAVNGFSELGLGVVLYGDYDNSKWGYIDKKGNWIIKPTFVHALNFNSNGLAVVKVNGKWGVIKLKDSTIRLLKYSNKGASSWAFEILEQAQTAQLVPDHLADDYKKYITREEFCDLIMNAYESVTKEPMDLSIESPFADTQNMNILKSYALGIVKGVTTSQFKPQNNMTRETMAVMLDNTLKALEYETELSSNEQEFLDEVEISLWAKESVHKLNELGVLLGIGNNRINPKGNVTREQAIALVYKLFTQVSEDTRYLD